LGDAGGARDAGIERAGDSTSRRASEAGRVAALTFSALALRLVMLGFDSVLTPDGVMYATHAAHFRAGNFGQGMDHYFPPLYSLLIALAAVLVGDIERAGQLVSAVAGSLVVVPTYLLARGAYGRGVAGLAALLAAAHPLLTHYSTVVLTEATFTTLFACAVYFGWRAVSGGRAGVFALAGLCLGACYLLKPEAAGFVPLLLLLAAASKIFDRKLTARGLAAGCAALVAGFLVAALPYVIYLRERLGHWTISGKAAAHLWYYARGAGAAPGAADESGQLSGLTALTLQLAKGFRTEFEFANFIFPPTFVAAVALGLFRAGWTRERARRELYMSAFVVATAAGYALAQSNARSFIPLLPLLLGWAALGIFEAEKWFAASAAETGAKRLARAVGGRRFRLGAAALLLLSLAPLTVYLMRGHKWSDYGGQRSVAFWIKERHRGGGPGPPRVLSTVPVTAFYAEGHHVWLDRRENYAAMIERARRGRVDYIVINERDFRAGPLKFLLDESSAPPAELRLLHALGAAPGFKILVYELADP
jgi:4-amino-4-deoxy-L-arabinose transferase-like glycosyltransferase